LLLDKILNYGRPKATLTRRFDAAAPKPISSR